MVHIVLTSKTHRQIIGGVDSPSYTRRIKFLSLLLERNFEAAFFAGANILSALFASDLGDFREVFAAQELA